MRSTNQHLTVYVSDHLEGLAVAGVGDLTAGQISFINALTGVGTAVPPTNAPYRAAFCDANSVIHQSQVINQEDIIRGDAGLVAPDAATQKVQTITIPAAPVVGDQYVLKLRVPGYGGLVGPEDECFFYGNYVVKAGDDENAVAEALKHSLSRSIAAATNIIYDENVPTDLSDASDAFVTVEQAGATITISGLLQPYVQARFDAKHVDFDASIEHPHAIAFGATTTVQGTPGNGNGHQVALREELYAGYGTNYKDRYANWPRVTEPNLATLVGKQYSRIAVTFATKYGEANRGRQRQVVECWFQTDGVDPTP